MAYASTQQARSTADNIPESAPQAAASGLDDAPKSAADAGEASENAGPDAQTEASPLPCPQSPVMAGRRGRGIHIRYFDNSSGAR
jgi:hypothetical protein